MPLCPLCFRTSIQEKEYWCLSCSRKLNKNVTGPPPPVEVFQISPESIERALRLMADMQPKMLTAPPTPLMLTYRPSLPSQLQQEIAGQLSSKTTVKPVLKQLTVPLDQREAAWKAGEAARVSKWSKDADDTSRFLREQLDKQNKAQANSTAILNDRNGLKKANTWLKLPLLTDISKQLQKLKEQRAQTVRVSKQDFDPVLNLQQEAADYLNGIQACMPTCNAIAAALGASPETAEDLRTEWERIKTYIDNTAPSANAQKLSEVTQFERKVMQTLRWKGALDAVQAQITFMTSDAGYGMKADQRDVLDWINRKKAIVELCKKDPFTVGPINVAIAGLCESIKRSAADKESAKRNASLNETAQREKKKYPGGGRLGYPVSWSTLSAEKKALARALKNNQAIPPNWEKCDHHNHPGGAASGAEYRLWSGVARAPGSTLGGLRMTSAGGAVYECSAHSANSTYNYLRVVGIPDTTAHPEVPATFPPAPAAVALLPV